MIFPVKGPISQAFGHYRVIPAGDPGSGDDKNALSVEPTAWIEYDGPHNPSGAKRAKLVETAGWSKFADVHMGVDVVCPVGSPVRAPADGVCVLRSVYPAIWNGKKTVGYAVLFQFGGGKILYVDHLSSFVAKVGQKVSEGGVIARTGGVPGVPGSGASFGPHAHVEVWASWIDFYRSTRLNPQRVLT